MGKGTAYWPRIQPEETAQRPDPRMENPQGGYRGRLRRGRKGDELVLLPKLRGKLSFPFQARCVVSQVVVATQKGRDCRGQACLRKTPAPTTCWCGFVGKAEIWPFRCPDLLPSTRMKKPPRPLATGIIGWRMGTFLKNKVIFPATDNWGAVGSVGGHSVRGSLTGFRTALRGHDERLFRAPGLIQEFAQLRVLWRNRSHSFVTRASFSERVSKSSTADPTLKPSSIVTSVLPGAAMVHQLAMYLPFQKRHWREP
jgi:hypothetical protein